MASGIPIRVLPCLFCGFLCIDGFSFVFGTFYIFIFSSSLSVTDLWDITSDDDHLMAFAHDFDWIRGLLVLHLPSDNMQRLYQSYLSHMY